jgi:hypothetical protein
MKQNNEFDKKNLTVFDWDYVTEKIENVYDEK